MINHPFSLLYGEDVRTIKRIAVVLLSITLTGCVFYSDAGSPHSSSDIDSVKLPEQPSSGMYVDTLGSLMLQYADPCVLEDLYQWQKVNPSVGAVLKIESLGIYYPVLIPNTDNNQWLRTNIYGESDSAGCIFADYRCNLHSAALKLIHGHNMKNDTMFGRVPELLSMTSCKDMPAIELTTSAGLREYEIFAVLSINSKEEAMPLGHFMSADTVSLIACDLLERSQVPDGVIHSNDIVVLNTCWYGTTGTERNLRCLVAASRVR